MKRLLLGLFAIPLALSSLSSAAIVFSGNFKTGTATVDQPTMTITAPIVLTLSAGGTASYLVFDELTTANGFGSVSDSPSAFLSYQLDGSSTATIAITSFFPKDNNTTPDVSPEDGLLRFSSLTIAGTDRTLTIPAGQTFTFTSNTNVAQPPASFSGNVFLLDFSFRRISNIAAAPEPSTALLGALGALGLLRRRR